MKKSFLADGFPAACCCGFPTELSLEILEKGYPQVVYGSYTHKLGPLPFINGVIDRLING